MKERISGLNTKPVTQILAVEVTREWAKNILECHNSNNRQQRQTHVDSLCELHNNNQWLGENHPDAIKFNQSGELIDGQHRLLAFLKSKKQTMWVRVELDCGEDVRGFIDNGAKRQLHDLCSFEQPDGWRNIKVSGIVKVLALWERGISPKALTAIEAKDFYRKYNKSIIAIVSRISRGAIAKKLTPVEILAALVCYHVINSDKALRFSDSLLATDGDVIQAKRLRDWMLSRPNSRSFTGGLNLFSRASYCMRKHLKDEDFQKVVENAWSKEEVLNY